MQHEFKFCSVLFSLTFEISCSFLSLFMCILKMFDSHINVGEGKLFFMCIRQWRLTSYIKHALYNFKRSSNCSTSINVKKKKKILCSRWCYWPFTPTNNKKAQSNEYNLLFFRIIILQICKNHTLSVLHCFIHQLIENIEVEEHWTTLMIDQS